MSRPRLACAAAFAICCGSGCERAGSAGREQPIDAAALPWFEEIARAAGVDVSHDSGHRRRFFFPECVSGGGAVLDFDNDGLLDLYIIQAGHVLDPPEKRPPNRLYRNLGSLHFEDVTERSGAGDRGIGMGVATGDFNNSGFIDLYIANLGRNTLLRNNGDGTFTDVTDVAGVGDASFGAAAAFLDYDLDGRLDLFVVNYVHWSPTTELFCTSAEGREEYCGPLAYHAPSDDVLYRNLGDGTFANVSVATGIAPAPGNGLGIVCGDFDNDGLIDVYIANDGTRNRLWINVDRERFEDRAMRLGVAIDDDGTEKAGMGVHAADLTGNGLLDLLVVNMFRQSDSLHLNQGDYFIDATAAAGLAAPSRRFTRFGTALHDFDNDGVLDLFQANGDIVQRPPYWGEEDRYAEPDILYRGAENGRFVEHALRGGTTRTLIATGRAAVFGDLDNDGGVDILVVNRDGPVHLLRNIATDRGNWIMFRVLDENGRDALGATVELTLAAKRLRRDVRTTYSYFAANDPRVHFGLGEADRVLDVSVIWPGGARESFGDFDAGQIVTLRRGVGTGGISKRPNQAQQSTDDDRSTQHSAWSRLRNRLTLF